MCYNYIIKTINERIISPLEQTFMQHAKYVQAVTPLSFEEGLGERCIKVRMANRISQLVNNANLLTNNANLLMNNANLLMNISNLLMNNANLLMNLSNLLMNNATRLMNISTRVKNKPNRVKNIATRLMNIATRVINRENAFKELLIIIRLKPSIFLSILDRWLKPNGNEKHYIEKLLISYKL